MEFKFVKTIVELMKDIDGYISDNQLPIAVHLNRRGWLVVTIKKFGTSTLSFKREYAEGYLYLILGDQNISWMHTPYIGKFQNQISEVLTSLGGEKIV